jgi:hypothetical protein
LYCSEEASSSDSETESSEIDDFWHSFLLRVVAEKGSLLESFSMAGEFPGAVGRGLDQLSPSLMKWIMP